MKKIFAIAMLFAAISMASCGGNGQKKAEGEGEQTCEKCEKADNCCSEKTERGGCAEKSECCEGCAEQTPCCDGCNADAQ